MSDDDVRDRSLAEALWERWDREPDAIALVFMGDDGREDPITCRQLRCEAERFARAFRRCDVGPGDVVINALRHSVDLIAAFLAAVYEGAVPSIFPYRFPRPDPVTHARQVRSLVDSSGASAVIVDESASSTLADALADRDARIVRPGHEPGRSLPDAPSGRFGRGEQTAYLQFTSGTTGLHKGVMLSHRAILSFIRSFQRALRVRPDDVVVSWLPLFHDYGLFAGLVFPLAIGIPTIIMSPLRFIRRPKTLLETIHDHRGTLCFMPNFAFNHLVSHVRRRELEGLDLTRLRGLVSGGEPSLLESQQAFLEHFAPCGFRETALMTGYGMAENTLAATCTVPGERGLIDWVDVGELQAKRAVSVPHDADGAFSVLSCGRLLEGAEARIVDEENGQTLPERHVGEIALRTSTLFSGYLGRPDLSARSMRNGWYLTGDLGYLASGELYVCGRKKDLIIVGGKNVYPHDLEAIANAVPGVYPDRSVAFGVPDALMGSEKIVMVCDLKRSVEPDAKVEIERELRRRAMAELDVPISDVRLFKKGWVVKTPNGKIPRAANRAKYESL